MKNEHPTQNNTAAKRTYSAALSFRFPSPLIVTSRVVSRDEGQYVGGGGGVSTAASRTGAGSVVSFGRIALYNSGMADSRSHRILISDSIRIWGGAQRFIVEFSEGLARRGHEVTIRTLPHSPLAERARARGLSVREAWTRTDAAPWTVIPLALEMRRRPYDFVITTFDKDLRTTGLAARLSGTAAKIIHTRECDDPVKNKARYRWFYTKVADHIVVNSRSTLDTTLAIGAVARRETSERSLQRNRSPAITNRPTRAGGGNDSTPTAIVSSWDTRDSSSGENESAFS